MKKFIYIIAALFLGLSQVSAQEIYVENFTAPEGGVQKFDVKYKGIEGKNILGYIFKFEFPEGLSLATDDKGKVIYEIGEENDVFDIKTTAISFQASPSTTDSKLSGESGTLMTLTLKVNNPLVQGDKATVKVYDASLTEKVENTDGTPPSYIDLDTDPFTFEVEIVENRITLDETVGVTDETPTGVQNVLVNRTIKAGNWNTICLPFAMTAEQVKTAFGGGVQLADFIGCEGDGDKDNPSTSIKVNFTAVDAIEANHPYLIKVETALNSFNVDEVTISPDEESAIVQMDKTSGRNPVYNSFVGTYNPSTIIPVGGLFLNSNQFYYSNGNSKLKAFRAYFDFAVNWLEEAPYAESKISISVDGDATSIDGIGYQHITEGVYDLSGRKIQLKDGDLNKLQKGVYIIDGKKVTIK